MSNFKKVLNAVLFPKPPINFIIAVLSFIFIGAIFLFDLLDTPIAYAAYLPSSYGLYLMIMALIVPIVRAIKKLLRKNKYIDRYFSDSEFKSRVSLYRGTAINIFFALFKLVSGIIYKSYWLAAIAFYYIALCVIKFVLVRNDIYLLRKKEISDRTLREWKAYRRAGKFIMLICRFCGNCISSCLERTVLFISEYDYICYSTVCLLQVHYSNYSDDKKP